MKTAFVHRLDLVVSAADRGLANEVAAMITDNKADLETFTVPLQDLSGKVTHFCCSTLATEQMLAAWKNAIASDLFLPIQWAQRDAATDTLKDTNLPVSKEQAWKFDQTLDALNLRIKEDG